MSKEPKTMKSFLLPEGLADWIMAYAKSRNTTMTRLIVDHFTELKKKFESGHVDQI
jgi:hypothetical protein